jgi:uncharacterized protein (TIGR00369 family)
VPFFVLNDLTASVGEDGIAWCRTRILPWLDGAAACGIQAGVAGLMDSVLSYPASAGAREGEMFVSVGMRIQYWEVPPEVGATLQGSASMLTGNGAMMLTSAEARADGRTVATGTLQSIAVPRARTPDQAPGPVDHPEIPYKSVSTVLDLPVSRMCRLEIDREEAGAVVLSVVAPPEFERNGGVVHGGAVAILGQLACAVSLETAEARRTELAVDYLRPTLVGQPCTLRAEVVHRSRRVAIVAGEIMDGSGRMTARFSETSILG